MESRKDDDRKREGFLVHESTLSNSNNDIDQENDCCFLYKIDIFNSDDENEKEIERKEEMRRNQENSEFNTLIQQYYLNETNKAQADKLFDTCKIRELQRLLKDAKSSGCESVGGEACELPNVPGVYIKGFGEVSLPLNEVNGESLIKFSMEARRSLYNNGLLVDNEARHSFEIAPNLIEIQNPEWESGLKSMMGPIAHALGCHGKIDATLNKLMIFKKGKEFNKYMKKDALGMLLLQLPSIYEGGHLVVQNNYGTKVTHDFGQSVGTAKYKVHYVAHNSDTNQSEFLEIESGYRLLLVYSLYWTNEYVSYRVNNYEAIEKMRKCLDDLNDHLKCLMAISLEHKYNDLMFNKSGIDALKGIDKHRFNLIYMANNRLLPERKLNFYIMQSNLIIKQQTINSKEEQNQDNSHSSWKEAYRSQQMICYDIGGAPRHIKIRNCFMYPKVVIDPNSVSEPFYTFSNELFWSNLKNAEGGCNETGSINTCTYEKYVILMWPEQFNTILSFSNEYSIEFLYRSLSDPKLNDENYQENLTLLVECLKNVPLLNEELTKMLMCIFLKVRNVELLKLLLTTVSMTFPISEFANIIVTYKWDVVKNSLSKLLLPVTIANIEKNCKLVKEIVYLNQTETACECFKYAVVPFLYDQSKDKCWRDECDDITIEAYFNLAGTIILFENMGINDCTDRFIYVISERLTTDNNQFVLAGLLNKFLQNERHFCRYELVLKLFGLRYKWLSKRLKDDVNLGWSMPGEINDNHEINCFLKSEDKKMVYSKVYSSIDKAQKFAEKYGGLKDGYSVRMLPVGTSYNAKILIVKTAEYFDYELEKLKEYDQELKKIKNIFNYHRKS